MARKTKAHLEQEEQALCFLAGANSIFYGEKLLTTGNPEWDVFRANWNKMILKTISRLHNLQDVFTMRFDEDVTTLTVLTSREWAEIVGMWEDIEVALELPKNVEFKHLYNLEAIHASIDAYQVHLNQEKEKAQKKSAALAKLSDEERKLLGL